MSTSLRFAHISDTHVRPDAIGRSQVFADHLAEIQAGDYDFVIHSGDLMDEPSAWAARAFGAIISQLQIPVYFVPGNHDVYNPHLGELQAPWWAKLAVDSNTEAEYRGWFGPTWHSFTCQGVHMVGIDSLILNSGLPEERSQWKWLEETLAELASREPEHLILFTHLPLFIHQPYEELDATDFANGYLVIAPPGRDRLLDLIRRYRVTTVLSGHIHAPWGISQPWPEGFTTQFVCTGSSGVPSPMAIDQFDLPLDPAQGMGYHEHRVVGSGFFSHYHQHGPAPQGGRWKLGRAWTACCPDVEVLSRQLGFNWYDAEYRTEDPDWLSSEPVSKFPLAASGGAPYYVRQLFEVEDEAAAIYLELLTERAVEIYVNGELLCNLDGLGQRPPAWTSAGGEYKIDSPILYLGLNQRLVRKGENVLALRVDGEIAARRGADAAEYIAYRNLEDA